MDVAGVLTIEGQSLVRLIFQGEAKHEDLGILGEQEFGKLFFSVLWRRKPLGETTQHNGPGHRQGTLGVPMAPQQSAKARGSPGPCDPRSYCVAGPALRCAIVGASRGLWLSGPFSPFS